jgi:hypothetical protein
MVFSLAALALVAPAVCLAQPDTGYKMHDWNRPRPPVVDPGTASTQDMPGRPPSDATVLFDGKDLSQWCALDGSPTKWVVKDGIMECVAGSGMIRTFQNFGDCQLHVEWAAPVPPMGKSQGRGNSGVYLMGLFEIQVLDNYQNETYADGYAASIYGEFPPLVNPARPPGQWQTYEIVFTRPRFNPEGRLQSPARATVLFNGVLVQNGVSLTGPTAWMVHLPYSVQAEKLPLALQDHGNPVRYRNIWVRELGFDAKQKEFTYSNALLDRYVGLYRVTPLLSIEILRRGAQLYMNLIGPGDHHEHALYAESQTRFFAKEVDSTVTFQVNDQGVVESLDFYMGGDTNRAKKIK